ncbi:hypothetical protein J6590_079483 [Homalodisca vitripennis]|nr:hypothetical protein J6590_079483 [Homalodisca vitripennis]
MKCVGDEKRGTLCSLPLPTRQNGYKLVVLVVWVVRREEPYVLYLYRPDKTGERNLMFSTSTDQTKRVQASGSSYVGGEERGTLCSLPLPTRQNGYKLVVLVVWVVRREEPYVLYLYRPDKTGERNPMLSTSTNQTKRVQASGSSYVGSEERGTLCSLPLPTRQNGNPLFSTSTDQTNRVQASGSSCVGGEREPMFSTSPTRQNGYKLVVLVMWVVRREEPYVLYLYRPDKTGEEPYVIYLYRPDKRVQASGSSVGGEEEEPYVLYLYRPDKTVMWVVRRGNVSPPPDKRVQASGSSYVGGEERGTLCSLPLPTRQNGYNLVVLVMWVVRREEPYVIYLYRPDITGERNPMFSTSTDQTKRVQASGSSYVGGEERGTLCSLPLPTRQNGYKLVVLVMWVVRREEPYVLYLYRPDKTGERNPMFSTSTNQTKRVQASGSSYVGGEERGTLCSLPLPTRQNGYKLVVLVMWVVRREEPYVLYLYQPDKTGERNPMFSTSTDQTKRVQASGSSYVGGEERGTLCSLPLGGCVGQTKRVQASGSSYVGGEERGTLCSLPLPTRQNGYKLVVLVVGGEERGTLCSLPLPTRQNGYKLVVLVMWVVRREEPYVLYLYRPDKTGTS